MSEHLLSSVQMAQFVASGYLKFEDMVPQDLCEACLEEMTNNRGYLAVGTPFGSSTWQGMWNLFETYRATTTLTAASTTSAWAGTTHHIPSRATDRWARWRPTGL